MADPFLSMTFRSWDREPIKVGSRVTCLGIDFGHVTVHVLTKTAVVLHLKAGSYWSGRMRKASPAQYMVTEIEKWLDDKHAEVQLRRVVEWDIRRKRDAFSA